MSAAVAELVEKDEQEEEDEEADVRECSSTRDLAPKQVLVLLETSTVVPGFWVVGTSDQAARKGLASSSRVQRKAPDIQAELTPLG